MNNKLWHSSIFHVYASNTNVEKTFVKWKMWWHMNCKIKIQYFITIYWHSTWDLFEICSSKELLNTYFQIARKFYFVANQQNKILVTMAWKPHLTKKQLGYDIVHISKLRFCFSSFVILIYNSVIHSVYFRFKSLTFIIMNSELAILNFLL